MGRDRTSVLNAAAATLGLLRGTLLESGMWIACDAPPDTRAASDAAAATSVSARTSGPDRSVGSRRSPIRATSPASRQPRLIRCHASIILHQCTTIAHDPRTRCRHKLTAGCSSRLAHAFAFFGVCGHWHFMVWDNMTAGGFGRGGGLCR